VEEGREREVQVYVGGKTGGIWRRRTSLRKRGKRGARRRKLHASLPKMRGDPKTIFKPGI